MLIACINRYVICVVRMSHNPLGSESRVIWRCVKRVYINTCCIYRGSHAYTLGSESSQQAMSASANGFILSLPTLLRASRGEVEDRAACRKSIMHTLPWGGT